MKTELDPGFLLLAVETMRPRTAALKRATANLRRGTDARAVHKARVASRRLRAALRVFQPGLPARSIAGWKKSVRKITRSLGGLRDLDVQIEFLRSCLADKPARPYRPGLHRLLLRLSRRRTALEKSIGGVVKKIERSGTFQNIAQSLREVKRQLASDHVKTRSPGVLEEARLMVILRLEQFTGLEPFLADADRVEELHAARIAAKRLRYTLEVFSQLYKSGIDGVIEKIRQMQVALGAIHDCDIWIESLPRFISEERARMKKHQGHTRGFSRIAAGVCWLQRDRREERDRLHREFLRVWPKEQQDLVWGKLYGLLEP